MEFIFKQLTPSFSFDCHQPNPSHSTFTHPTTPPPDTCNTPFFPRIRDGRPPPLSGGGGDGTQRREEREMEIDRR
ncbi:hypothetical protein Hdeb2414_s0004g00130111 [Helianthus debilis subsp. tardiflorus]